jgi:predicted dinucleotide-binding enzyme
MLETLLYALGISVVTIVTVYWFYFRKQVTELKDQVQDKKIIISSLIDHQSKIEKEDVKIVKTAKQKVEPKKKTTSKKIKK